jgi:hypothetical protein
MEKLQSLDQSYLTAALSHHLLAVLSFDARVIQANAKFVELLGHDPAAGSAFASSIGLVFLARLKELKAGKTCKLEATLFCRPADQLWLLPVLSPLFEASGAVDRVLFSAIGMFDGCLFVLLLVLNIVCRHHVREAGRRGTAQPSHCAFTLARRGNFHYEW